ncbi:hypothetical protein C2G38_2027862 [Gigaspora rosea]|uniref:Dickkopf N-terminal cysteine-rich domain-containing protein n=1 Tax=Gigaspora rosea TaxID=44941 RepID=A0A397W3J6_9GLOM|nr:hypothetical protein C2G38_2027862 [Gigaspora rosea]CAG8460087.1 9226_t:CDS:1 [Gigaspora rosea]
MSKFQTKKFFSIMLFVMLFFVLTNAVRNDLKKRQTSIGLGQPCHDQNDDSECVTKICRIKGEDIHKCQLTDQRVEGEPCLTEDACNGKTFCNGNKVCETLL